MAAGNASAAAQEAPGGPGLQPLAPRSPTAPATVPPTSPAAGADRLRIGGLTPLTTVDYPGKLAAVVFCQGCPWRCRYCHNTHLIPARAGAQVSWGQVRAFLGRRHDLLDAVVFSGGEPTIQSGLIDAAAQVRDLGFRVGLHTGGPCPERLRRLLPLLDWVGLDIKALPAPYPDVTGVPGSGEKAWECLDLLLESHVAVEVRTTLMPGWTLAEPMASLMGALAARGVGRYVVQAPRLGTCLDPSLAGSVPPAAMEEIATWGTRLFSNFALRRG